MRNNDLRRLVSSGAALLAMLLVAGAGATSAQTSETPAAGLAWLGCWEPVGAAVDPAHGGVLALCVVPVAGTAALEVITVDSDRVVERERITVGAQWQSGGQGCSGTETVTASPDGRRIYRQSEHACEGDLRRSSTGLMSMLPSGEWLDVQSITAGGFTDVRVVRYRPAVPPAAVEAEMALALQDRGLAIDAARINAAAPVELAHLVEATRAVDAGVVEVWLLERGQGFALDASRLLELADAGVSERVIDLVVALSYPQRFAVNPMLREAALRPEVPARSAEPRVYRPGFGFGPTLYPGFGWSYGYGRGYGYGYAPGFGYGYSAYPVVIVVRGSGDDEAAAPRGRAVPGRGYTRTGQGNATPARTTPSAGRSGTTSTSPRPAATSSGSGGSAPTRTAKPRPQDD